MPKTLWERAHREDLGVAKLADRIHATSVTQKPCMTIARCKGDPASKHTMQYILQRTYNHMHMYSLYRHKIRYS